MTIYLDVRAGRIQVWLARSATLRGRRGASSLLARLTREQAISQWLATQPNLAEVRWNPEAGDVDSRVSLVLADSTGDEGVAAIARSVLSYLRRGLPRVELQATWALAPTYVAAYEQMRHRFEEGTCLTEGAQPRTIPLAKICEDCGLDGVVHPQYFIASSDTPGTPDTVDVCADCEARYEAAGRTTGTTPEIVPGPELDLATWLEAAPSFSTHPLLIRLCAAATSTAERTATLFRSIPDDATTLASATSGPDGRTGTHLALIYADGNQMGQFLRRFIDANADTSQLVGQFTQANREAVVQATLAVLDADPDLGNLPVAPHLIAGDDLLVSVPATLAWPFVRTYLPAFTRRLRQHCGLAMEPLPTTSAGVVFAHCTYPFADVMRLAAAALDDAKRVVRGAQSSVAWLDITAEGPTRAGIRPPLPTAVITQHEAELEQLALLPAALRVTLARACQLERDGENGRGVVEEIQRLDVTAATPFLANPGLPLDRALELARWWR